MKKEICYSDLILLTNDIVSNVEELLKHGTNQVELLMDGYQWDEMENLFDKLLLELKALPASYSLHPPAWDINLTSENRSIREASFNEYKKTIEFAGMINASHVVIHPGFCFAPFFNKKLAQERAFDSIQKLSHIAKPLGVKLAIENVGYKGSSLFTEKEFISFLDGADESACYLIDVGHAHLNDWDIPNVIKQIECKLIALHLHDNNGVEDEHLPIGEGTIEWQPILNLIEESDRGYQLILEYATGTPLEKLEAGKKLLRSEGGVYR